MLYTIKIEKDGETFLLRWSDDDSYEVLGFDIHSVPIPVPAKVHAALIAAKELL